MLMNFSLSDTEGGQWSANRKASKTCMVWSLLGHIWLDPLWCNTDLMQRKERRHPSRKWWNRRFSPPDQNPHLSCHNCHFLFLFMEQPMSDMCDHMIFTFHILSAWIEARTVQRMRKSCVLLPSSVYNCELQITIISFGRGLQCNLLFLPKKILENSC